MKRLYKLIPALMILASLCACSVYAPRPAPRNDGAAHPLFRRETDPTTYTDITFNAWDTDGAARSLEPQPQRAHTLMIYINGSDLESEAGAATDDINEMLASGADTDGLNILLLTGGANRWQSREIPAAQCVVSRIRGGELERIAQLGQRNMGDAGTLASFISFGMERFPAGKYSLILWDHGGGTIAGFGMDEHFEDGTLSLLEMEYAFERAGLRERKLEMLGFDACLMASAEMAVVASRYAEYLVASQALEPQDGWDYGVLRRLGRKPQMGGAELGRHIADAYILSGGVLPLEEMSLSVVRLDEAENVMGAMGALMARCRFGLDGGLPGFQKLARLRSATKTFGDGSPMDGDCDMVDLLDMAERLEGVFPREARALRDAVNSAVAYNRYASKTRLGGLSSYYIYGGNTDAAQAMKVYRALAMSAEYTEYLDSFAARMYADSSAELPGDLRGEIESAPDTRARVLGANLALYEIAQPPGGTLYASPALVNGHAADIVVYAADGEESGRVLGYRRADGYLIQKGYIPFARGDAADMPDGGRAVSGGELAGAEAVITRPPDGETAA